MTPVRPSITLVNGTEDEQLLSKQLLVLFDRYPLSKWLYTEQVQIEEGAIPHSHPVLTLTPKTRATDYLSNSEHLLAAYVHEQLHWFMTLDDASKDLDRVYNELHTKYPNLPVGYPEGCRSEFSNYVHVVVNFLEYRALRELLGVASAKAVIERHPFYRAVYALVLKDYEPLGVLLSECGLVPPEQPPADKHFRLVKHIVK